MGNIFEAMEWQRRDCRNPVRPVRASRAAPAGATRAVSIARFNAGRLRANPGAAAYYTELKNRFLSLYGGQDVRTILFAGVEPGVGATSCAVHFAGALSREHQHGVLLIDTDFARHNLDRYFNTRRNYSLMNLDGAAGAPTRGFLAPPVEGGHLYVVPSTGGGANARRASGVLQSPGFRHFVGDMRGHFDYTVLDAPPLRLGSDTAYLSGQVDGVVLVIEAGRTPRWRIEEARGLIQEAGGRTLGVVLNRRRYPIPGWLYRLL